MGVEGREYGGGDWTCEEKGRGLCGKGNVVKVKGGVCGEKGRSIVGKGMGSVGKEGEAVGGKGGRI